MSDAETLPDGLKEHLTPLGESHDADYLAWRDRKVQEALDFANAHPEKMISERAIWAKFGLEY